MRTVSYMWGRESHGVCWINTNYIGDEDVRADMSDALDRIAPAEGPKGEALYRHELVHTL
jgi:hypothetical protein